MQRWWYRCTYRSENNLFLFHRCRSIETMNQAKVIKQKSINESNRFINAFNTRSFLLTKEIKEDSGSNC